MYGARLSGATGGDGYSVLVGVYTTLWLSELPVVGAYCDVTLGDEYGGNLLLSEGPVGRGYCDPSSGGERVILDDGM